MAIRLSEVIRRQIEAHGALDFPHECCGAMLGTLDRETMVRTHPGDDACETEVCTIEVKTVRALVPAVNVHDEGHERRFLIDPQTMLLLEKQERAGGLKVVGFYHSHPNHPASPSQYDLDASWPWYSYVILSVMDARPAEMTSWVVNNDRSGYEPDEILA